MASPKTKQAPPSPPTPPAPAAPASPYPKIAAMVDELGDIDRRLAPVRTLIAREEALRKNLRAAHTDHTADQEVRAAGSRFYAILGPKAAQRSIDFVRLVKKIGAARFVKFATCSLEALEKHAPGAEAEFVTKANTGSRPIRIFDITPEVKA